MKLTQEAISRLERVKEQILAEPDTFIMGSFTKSKPAYTYITDSTGFGANCPELSELRDKRVELNPRCGTAACIAGWLCLQDRKFNDTIHSYEDYAGNLLGIRSYERGELFYTSGWPEDLARKFATLDLSVRAEAACEVIDRFIASHR